MQFPFIKEKLHMITKPLLAFAATALLASPAWATPGLHIGSSTQCPLTLKKGQPLHVTLITNHSIGYKWQLTHAAPELLSTEVQGAPVKEAVQEGARTGEIPPPKHVAQLGGDSLLRWSFTAHSAGDGQLKLVQLLPRLHGDTPQKTFNCAITVTP